MDHSQEQQQQQQQQQQESRPKLFRFFDRDDVGDVISLEGTTLLLDNNDESRPVLIHRDSEFTVNSEYSDGVDAEEEHNNLNCWQGALLLTADCLGTGLLALPSDVRVLGTVWGLSFLVANLPINWYAGSLLHQTAQAVEERQQLENRVYTESRLRSMGAVLLGACNNNKRH